jgi:preprotein translocase SecF subunit
MRIFEDTNIAFVPNRRTGYIISGILLTLSIASLLLRGLELGIDFRGGMEFVVEGTGQVTATEARDALGQRLGQDPEVKTFGAGALLVRTAAEEGGTAQRTTEMEDALVEALGAAFPDTSPEVVKADVVGPRFAEDLKRGALFAILGSLFVIFMYILIRFEWRFGVGAVAALLHDVTITLGLFSLLAGVAPFSVQIDQAIIAAFLTIVGYSLNDTVVVFDRIREYTNVFKTESFEEVSNRSINGTLSRTFVTSGTTLLVVITLFLFGGEVLKGFSFALIIGVVIGTYSSIFIATPTVVELKARQATAAA